MFRQELAGAKAVVTRNRAYNFGKIQNLVKTASVCSWLYIWRISESRTEYDFITAEDSRLVQAETRRIAFPKPPRRE